LFLNAAERAAAESDDDNVVAVVGCYDDFAISSIMLIMKLLL
jgi:hypothetical protein